MSWIFCCGLKSCLTEERNSDAGAAQQALSLHFDSLINMSAWPVRSSSGIISTFLNVHPFGASIEYICSYLQRLDSKVTGTHTHTRIPATVTWIQFPCRVDIWACCAILVSWHANRREPSVTVRFPFWLVITRINLQLYMHITVFIRGACKHRGCSQERHRSTQTFSETQWLTDSWFLVYRCYFEAGEHHSVQIAKAAFMSIACQH